MKGLGPAAAVEAVFETALADSAFAETCCETREKKHGRIDVRRCWTLDITAECGAPFDPWKGPAGIVRVEAERTLGGKTSREARYYITSRANFAPADALASARSHWAIENQLHWVLDVSFREDDCRVRAGHVAENFAVLRHFAINLIRSVPSPVRTHPQAGVQTRRLFASGNDQYLFRLFGIHS